MNQIHKVIGLYGNISNQLVGYVPIDSTFIDTYEKYCDIYKTRHDLVHSLICDHYNLDFGEKTVEQLLIDEKINTNSLKYYESVKKQSPDYLRFNSLTKTAKMMEISVSRSHDMKRQKLSKYALLSHFITKELKFALDYRVIVIYPLDVYRDRHELLMLGLSDPLLDKINDICRNTELLLSRVHETEEGQSYFLTFNDKQEEGISLQFTSLDVIKTYNENKTVFLDQKQFVSYLDGVKTTQMNIDSIMNAMLPLVDSVVPELLVQPKQFSETVFWSMMKEKSNSKLVRSVFPLPYIKMSLVDSSVRSTGADLEDILRISAKMLSSEDPIISHIGDQCSQHFNKKETIVETNDDLCFPCHLSKELKSSIALDGPGRKHYIKNGSKQHINEQKKYNGYAMDPDTEISDISRVLLLLSNKQSINETGDIFANTDSLILAKGIGLDYVRVCQSIYREVNINAMRGDRRRLFILKPTGILGVSVLLWPGPKIRSGEMPNLVWFKVIIERELYIENDLSNHWMFKKIHLSNQIIHSDWLSADVHRLDHYIRAYDKIMMVYCSYLSLKSKEYSINEMFVNKSMTPDKDEFMSMMTDKDELLDMMRNQSLVGIFNTDKTDALGLIISIYLEDRRSTSKMLQNIRYLFMTSISLTPQYMSVYDKMSEAIRSPLQLYLLQNSVAFIKKMRKWKPNNNCFFGKIRYDQKTQILNDSNGGSVMLFPRMLIKPDDLVNFHEILCEMYFTMLFNKNQDDPTHASFQVLDKIIEGEESYNSSKSRGMIYGEDGVDSIEYARKIVLSPALHQYSRHAIEVGSKLLRLSHMDPLSDEIKRSCLDKNVNKTLDEFATFKSSATSKHDSYDPKVNRQNARTKCVNAIMPLLNDGLFTSFDVAEKYKKEITTFQVFKKNQIGGVREILILPITTRIRINIIETISRNICNYDQREILTHGSTKFESVKSVLYRSKKHPDMRCPIHITFDKSRWGPTFIPMQFMSLFSNFKDKMGSLYYLILDILIRHQRKKCYMPDRLVKAWYLDQDNLHKHKYKSLQNVKNKFLMDKKLTYQNESNMGQGILHFTSSYLHLSLIAFRDELYKRYCRSKNWSYDDHEDLLSSDDSYTLFSPEIKKDDSQFIRKKLKAFLSCQEISERLFNCRTSLSKSSINPFIGEFNSLFISNMTFVPTLIKFALSSVHPVNTDSFFRMVKESYSSCRQIIENGGTLDLYLLSHKFNKIYCESIYHSYEGGFNDRRKLNLINIPYQMGEYPIFNPALMIIFGPEYYNYKMYKQSWANMTPLEKKFFINCHKVIKGDVVSAMGEFEDGENLLGGLLRIEAAIGPVNQLENFRRSAVLDINQMREIIINDPLIILRRATTLEETKFKTCQKLYTNGSKEAVKTLAASIFYGRVSATVSAKAFKIPGFSKEKIESRLSALKNEKIKISSDKLTYGECLFLILHEDPIKNFDDEVKFFYPSYHEYELFLDKETFLFDYKRRNPLEIQTIQKMITHKIRTRLINPIVELLEYHWSLKPIPLGEEGKVTRDMDLIKMHYDIIKPSMELTCDQFTGDKQEQVKKMLMLILKLFRLRDRSFKGVIFGPGSDDIVRTYLNLLEKNATFGFTTRLQKDKPVIHNAQSYEELFCAHNYDLLSILNGDKPLYLEQISENVINSFLTDPSIGRNQKKRIFMMALCTRNHIKNIVEWSGSTSTVIHYWRVKQQYINGKYQGDFELCLFSGYRNFILKYNSLLNKYFIYFKMESDPELLYLYLKESSEVLQVSVDEIIGKLDNGNFILQKEKIIKTESIGFKMTELNINLDIPYNSCNLEIKDDRLILKNWDNHKNSKILTIEIGLFPTLFDNIKVPDKYFFGLSFIKMIKIGAFNQNFTCTSLTKEQALDCLDDLKIIDPEISDKTAQKFPFLSLQKTIKKDEESPMEIMTSDVSISGFMDIDFSMEDLGEIKVDDDRIDLFLGYISTSELTSVLNVSTKIIQTRKILNVIRGLKYELITYMYSTQVRLSTNIIKLINKVLDGNDIIVKESIIKSLIAIYDRQENTPGSVSPDNIDFSVYSKFMSKFNIN